MAERWPVCGGEIIHSTENEYISTISKEVYRFSAKYGQGNKLMERYDRILDGKEIDYAEAGFFAMIGGVLVGGITYHIHFGWVYLHCGYVWEQYRGIGVYSALMQSVEDTARYNNLSGIWVSTYEFEAPEIYEHMGFVRGSVLTNCPEGNTSIDYVKDFFVAAALGEERGDGT